MRWADKVLQGWRERVARPWIVPNARVLDIGCHQGEFLLGLGTHIRDSVGIDPLAKSGQCKRHQLLSQPFREPLEFNGETFDAVVMLATLEHVCDKEPLARECKRLLRPGGRVIVTVPSPRVDAIVHGLVRLGVADGMSLDEHHGFNPLQTQHLFEAQGFRLVRHRRFQCGLNHLFVFAKSEAHS